MSEDKKPAPMRPDPTGSATAGDRRAPVRVEVVHFDRPLMIPGRGSASVEQTKEHPNGQAWTIDYLPDWDQFRIRWTDVHRKKDETGYVPASRVLSWRPL